MKSSRNALFISSMALVIATLSWALVYYGRDEFKLTAERRDDDIPTRSALSLAEGYAVVRISAESQAASGIVTATLAAARCAASAEVYGLVLNPQNLLELRGQYLAAAAEIRGLRAASGNSRSDFERMQQLFADDRNISARALAAAEAQWQTDQARLAAAEQNAASLQDRLQLAWGPQLARWAAVTGSTPLDALAAQREYLLQMSFPAELQPLAGNASLTLVPTAPAANPRHGPRSARYLSVAPQSDPTLPGATYLYLVQDPGLRYGMRVVGQLPLGGKARSGVIIPSTAIVWHGGQAWAYLKQDQGRFLRKPVATREAMGNGWFTDTGFVPGDQVVISGAQLLLSEEQKFQIRNENED